MEQMRVTSSPAMMGEGGEEEREMVAASNTVKQIITFYV